MPSINSQSIDAFLETLASKTPAPGGGATACLAGALACAQAQMVVEYSLGKPGREVLFTVVPRADKYKAKLFLDSVVYRGSDMVNGWAHTGLSKVLGLGLSGIAYVAIPMAAIWMVVAGFLGREHDSLARNSTTARDGDARA